MISPSRTTVPESNRSSPTSLYPTRSSPIPTNPVTVPIVDSLPTQIHDHPPPPIIGYRHEIATDEPSTPLTHTTYRDNLRQDLRSTLLEDGHLPIAPRYELQKHHRDVTPQYALSTYCMSLRPFHS